MVIFHQGLHCTPPPATHTQKFSRCFFFRGCAAPLTPLPLIGQQFCVLVCRICNPHMLLCWYIFIWRTYWNSWRPPGYYILKCFEHFSYSWYKVDWTCVLPGFVQIKRCNMQNPCFKTLSGQAKVDFKESGSLSQVRLHGQIKIQRKCFRSSGLILL